MPSRPKNSVRLGEDDWRRIASISAEYCLFWLTTGSFCWIRFRSQGMKEVFLPRDSAIAVLDERFSITAMIDQHHSAVLLEHPVPRT